MVKSTIAIITDSSCDIPRDYIEQHHIFVMPLQVNMPDGQYYDGVDITPDEVYARMPKVIPSTSQPSPGYVQQVLERIKGEGYQEAIAVCMSSGLSGTYSVICMCAKEVEGLVVHAVDSHRLSMALGLLVMWAVEMNEKGRPSREIIAALNDGWKNTNAFFCMPSLLYLIKGGRIGLVEGTIGTLLRIVLVLDRQTPDVALVNQFPDLLQQLLAADLELFRSCAHVSSPLMCLELIGLLRCACPVVTLSTHVKEPRLHAGQRDFLALSGNDRTGLW